MENNKGLKGFVTSGKMAMWAFMMLAFILPFGKVFAGIASGIFVVAIVITAIMIKTERSSVKNKMLLFFTLYYFFHIAGMIWSINKPAGFFDLEIKVALLVFPVILYFFPYRLINDDLLRKILLAFISGCFVSGVISMSIALVHFMKDYDITLIYYTQASVFMHTSYISMYIILAFLGIYFLFVNKNKKIPGLIVVMLVFLVLYMNFLNSKAGLLSFIAAGFMISFHIIFIEKKYSLLLKYVLLPSVILGASVILIPFSTTRVQLAVEAVNENKQEKVNSGESTADRMLIWESAVELANSNLIYGTGTGDVKDELIKKYLDKGYTYPAEFKLNAHNQFLQSYAALGIGALLLLLAMFIWPFILAVKRRHYLYIAFLIVMGLNIMVESMLEVQAGVLFYSFWNSLFIITLFNSRSIKSSGGAE